MTENKKTRSTRYYLKEYGFTTDRKESLSAKLSMRVAPLMLDELKKQDNWQELVRTAIAEKLHSA